jgi:hypothetical protein
MLGMQRSVRQKVVAAAAVAVLLGGGAFAAVSATGQRDGHPGKRARSGARHGRARDLRAAASYLGISTAALSGELRSGKSLAQVAAARGGGKTADGLIEAIVAERKARLQKTAAALPQRVSAEVARSGGPEARGARSPGRRAALGLLTEPGHLGASAAAYLGVPLPRLRNELRSGKTLAEVADATPGKSRAGLVAALLAAKQAQIAARTAGHRAAGRAAGAGSVAGHSDVTARAKRRAEHLQQRIGRLVERKFVLGSSRS